MKLPGTGRNGSLSEKDMPCAKAAHLPDETESCIAESKEVKLEVRSYPERSVVNRLFSLQGRAFRGSFQASGLVGALHFGICHIKHVRRK